MKRPLIELEGSVFGLMGIAQAYFSPGKAKPGKWGSNVKLVVNASILMAR
jgi:hypothetical protein